MQSVIIEDEESNRIVLETILNHYCKEVEIVGMADSVESGISLIQDKNPELIFMDIQLIGGTGFDILEKIGPLGASVIFTTAYDQYAVKAFRVNAVDYLLKPIDIEELKSAVRKVRDSEKRQMKSAQIDNLLGDLKKRTTDEPILLISNSVAIDFVRINDIIRVEAQGAYSKFYMRDGKTFIASKVMKEFEAVLRNHHFCRVHQSHLVNLAFISKYLRAKQCILLLNGTKISLSRSRKGQFFGLLEQYHG